MPCSKKKLEAEFSSAFIKFQRELLCRVPQEAKTYIVQDMVITRFKGVLTSSKSNFIIFHHIFSAKKNITKN